MVEKQDSSQGELFSAPDNGGPYRGRMPKSSFFWRMRGYEKAMLIIMGLVLISIIAFSFGVEAGKRQSEQIVTGSSDGSYTIQVATFKSKSLALAQAQFLRKEGLSPLVFAKGNYIVLCVGKFSNQESAQPLLIQMQRAYAGCRIRRL